MSLYSFARAGVLSPPVHGRLSGSLTWEGHIVARSWPADFTEDDYRAMLAGGKSWLERVDYGGRLRLTDAQMAEANRLLDRECLDGFESHNVACNAGRAIILNWLTLVAGQTGCNYFAVGTGSSTVNATDTQLNTEFFRKAISTYIITGNQADLSTFFNTTDGNTTYTEAGAFGNGATGTANSGTLFAHAAYAYTKTNTVTLTNDYFITFN